MLGVQALGSSLESSPEQDSSLKVGLEQDLKLMDLVNGDTREQPSSEIREVEENDMELKRQLLKALLSLSLPSGLVPLRGELGLEQQEEEEQQQELELELEVEVELEREQEEVESQLLQVVNKGDVAVPPPHPKDPPSNQTSQQPAAAAAQNSVKLTAMVFLEAAPMLASTPLTQA